MLANFDMACRLLVMTWNAENHIGFTSAPSLDVGEIEHTAVHARGTRRLSFVAVCPWPGFCNRGMATLRCPSGTIATFEEYIGVKDIIGVEGDMHTRGPSVGKLGWHSDGQLPTTY